MQSKYNPKEFEDKIYSRWMEQQAFKAVVNPDKKPFTIVLPPPNITGQLHMGHALDQALQDVLIRFKKMSGYEALWLPGTDHASIATEVKVLEKIKDEEGLSKDQLSREQFLEYAWAWKEKYGDRIVEQMKKLGSACDWSRERFTMDEGCNKAVTEVFIRLFKKGYIYRGYRLINWCPDCMTSLSDAEVEHEDKDGHFYHILYPIKDSTETIEIATTRPETMLGDTAVCVHPEDSRYSHLIGKTCILPLVNREIPIIADTYVDRETGTGALKVTPAHDPNDFELGNKHHLEQKIILTFDAKMTADTGVYAGLDRYEARKRIVEDLKQAGLMVKMKDHTHAVGTCYRCDTVVEPMLSDQWFVKMEEMAKPAIEAVANCDLNFVPERFTKIYLQWLEQIRDWCISRQLWWGHRIPAYYCQSCKEILVDSEMPDTCPSCGGTEFKQDEDVLDTWFSSALWPFSTLGWPDQTEDFNYFYPTSVLVTGYDIIFFWVVRMVFSGYEQTNQSPFDTVYIHGLVRDAHGKKMSKSSGNGVDPLDVIEQYGADALRFMLITGNSPGADQRFQMDRVEAARNFANKLWNASRFVMMGIDDIKSLGSFKTENLELSDRYILSRLNHVIDEVTQAIDRYDLGLAGTKVYEFVWDEYCDWYIELAKARLYSNHPIEKQTVQGVLIHVLETILKLIHPFMPFISEEIWSYMDRDAMLLLSQWPAVDSSLFNDAAEKDMQVIMDAIKSVRNARQEMNIPPSKKARIMIQTDQYRSTFELYKTYLIAMASASDVSLISAGDILPEDTLSAVIAGAELFIPLDDLIDYEKELERLLKEAEKLNQEVNRVVSKLNNHGFIAKAPEALVQEEKDKQRRFEEMLSKVNERIAKIKAKVERG